MSQDKRYDYEWAVANTAILRRPQKTFETFDATCVNYHLVAELEDFPGKIRIREGRLLAHQPTIVTPEAYAQHDLQGFGDEARRYFEEAIAHLHIVRYGFCLAQEAFSEQVVTDNLENVTARMLSSDEVRRDPFAAVIRGVDNPWDVCLLKFFREHAMRSAPQNFKDFENAGFFTRDAEE